MRHPQRTPARRLLAGLAAATAAAVLAGCFGGSDDDDAPPVTATAVADAATATWNSPLTVDVLANDSVSRGAKTLAAVVAAPANGTATVTDGRIVYTPRAGFYGSDSLRYTLRAAEGDVTAEGTLAITVEAALTLRGRAIDAPLAQAAVVISGAASAATTTDAQGGWSAAVRVSDAAGVVHISATGSAPKAHVRLVGAAAASDLAAAAAPDGTVAAETVEALTVTHFSTALAALAERAHGRVPGTAAALAEARAKVDAGELLNLATLIHMLADEGLALPAGKADTWALAGDATAVAALLAAQATADGQVFAEAQARALGAVPAAGLLPTAGTLVAYPVSPFTGGGAVFTLAADGTARVTDSVGSANARWVQGADGLLLTLDTPITWTTDTFDDANNLVGVRNAFSAYRLKRLTGGLVAMSYGLTQTILEGPQAGQVTVDSEVTGAGMAQRLAIDPAAAAPLAAGDFAVGKRWAGVLTQPGGGFIAVARADVLEITAAGSGRAVRDGNTWTVQASGAAFTLTNADGSRMEYQRLGDAGGGALYFMVRAYGAPGASPDSVTAVPTVLVPPGPAFVFDTANASRVWRLDSGPGAETPTFVTLRPDGTGTYFTPATWQVQADGRLDIVRNLRQVNLGNGRTEMRQTRYSWIPLSRGSDGSVWMLRTAVSENPAAPQADNAPGMFWSLFHYFDTGPAS